MCVLINLHPMSILSAGGGSFPMKSTKSDRLGSKIKEKQATRVSSAAKKAMEKKQKQGGARKGKG